MPNFTVSTDISVIQALSSGQTGVVTANGSLVTTAGTAVAVGPLGSSMIVAGALVATSYGVSGSGSHRLDVGATGIVSGGLSALRMTSGEAIVSNAGTMSGGSTAISFAGTSLTVVNSGNMAGNNTTGIFAVATLSVLLTNSGDISATSYGVFQQGAGSETISNSGTISGRSASLTLGDGVSTVTNSGTLLGDVMLGGGNDRFDGTAGVQSEVLGSFGNDTIRGGAQAETLDGGSGVDLLVGGAGDDRLVGGTETDSLRGGAGDDWLTADSGNDQMRGGGDDDSLFGGTGTDTMWGGSGDDILIGSGDNDTLLGGDGDDSLQGGTERDRMVGGAGDDTLAGGTDIDTFVFLRNQGTDIITDFVNDLDKIDLRAFDFANSAAVIALSSFAALGLRIDLPGEGVLFVQGLTTDTFNINDLLL